MRKLIFVISLLAFCLSASGQDTVSVKNVTADSLVRAMRLVSGNSIHIADPSADESLYSLSAPAGDFLTEALEKLRQGGYSVTEYGGMLFLIRGRGIQTSLSPSWFNIASAPEPEAATDEDQVKATYQNKVYEIGDPRRPKKGMVTIHGTIKDIKSGEPVPGISVSDERTSTFALTDAFGAYSISLPPGNNALLFSGYPMDDVRLEVVLYDDGGLDIDMKEKVTTLSAAAVSAESVSNHRTALIGAERLQLDRIRKIPAAFGESDLIKAVLALPGVQSVGEASSGFNVRGGSVDQNLILFNGGTIYNPNHMFGIFSAFNSDIVSEAELYKSSIPAEFGGRISSVLDIHSKEGNSKKITGALGLGLLTSRFELEGPIIKDRTTFVLGGRTTYSNWMLDLIPQESHYHGGRTSFQDANASLTHKINDRNSLHVYGYYSGDRFSFSTDTVFIYRNLNASMRWRSMLNPRHTMDFSAGYDNYQTALDADKKYAEGSYRYSSGITQEFAKLKFKFLLSPSHTLTYGADAVLYDISPGNMVPVGESSLIRDAHLEREKGLEPAIYLSDAISIGEKLGLEAGARLGAFKGGGGFYAMPEARLSVKYSILANLTAKAGFNTMRQNIHLLTNTSTVSPMDVWVLASEKIKPQDGYQAAGGLYWTIGSTTDISLEGYYKRSYNSLDYRSGAILLMNENLTDDLVSTTGKSYGIEFMARKSVGKLNGWLSYSYSRALMQETDEDDPFPINHGNWYSAPHDKPHSFKMAANYKFTHRYSISANVDYSTGRPITVPLGTYSYGGRWRLAYSERNSYRIPDYFRLDLALNVEPGHYLKQLTHMSFTLGVYNVTGRKNAYSVYYTMEGANARGYMISVFASQIPYINLNLNF